jgi:hypothetical protein
MRLAADEFIKYACWLLQVTFVMSDDISDMHKLQ